MPKTSIRTTAPPGQDQRVPQRMTLIAQWRTPDRYRMALHIDLERLDGRLIAADQDRTVVAACIAEAGTSFTASWTGELNMPWPWLNAQRAVAHTKYTEHQR